MLTATPGIMGAKVMIMTEATISGAPTVCQPLSVLHFLNLWGRRYVIFMLLVSLFCRCGDQSWKS